MKKLFKKLALMVVALLTFSIGSNYTVKEVKAAGEKTATLSFANKAQRTIFTSTQQVWEQNDIKLTNDKAASTNNVADYANPARFYANSKITVEAPGKISKIIFDTNSSSHATAMKNSIGTTASTSVSSDKVTVTLDGTADLFTVSKLTAQVKMDALTVTYTAGGGTVDPEPEEPKPSITISGNSYTQIGENLTLTAKIENTTGSAEWTSSDNTVATVNNGVVTPVSMGKVTITASVDDVKDSHEITVYPEANSELTIAEAIEVCELTGELATPYTYKTTGTVTSFEWSDKYSNYETTIEDETGKMGTYGTTGTGELYIGANITVTGSLQNYKGNTPQFGIGSTYILNENEELKQIREELNTVDSYMSLAYSYKATTTTEEVVIPSSVKDVLTRELTGKTTTTYGDWEGSLSSGATYKGNSAGSNSSIQLRSDNSNSGIVTTTSGGKVTKITVKWNDATKDGRTLDVYGKSTAYKNPTELYNSSTQGTKLGSVKKGTSTELIIADDYEYIGLRSASGAMYLTSISIEWETGAASGETEIKEVTTLSDSQFFIRCGVDVALSSIEGIDSYGIKVTANGKEVYYDNSASSWGTELNVETPYHYVVISLGDIIKDFDRLSTEFTVEAYVEYDGKVYCSTNEKTYSVVSMVEKYHDESYDEVEHLYNYFVENKLVK